MSNIILNIEQFSSKIQEFYKLYNTTLSNRQKLLDKGGKNPLVSLADGSVRKDGPAGGKDGPASENEVSIITAEPGKELKLTGIIEFLI